MRPNNRQLARTLRRVGHLLDIDRADYCFEGRFRFPLHAGWSLVISADDAGRFRLEACFRSRVRRTIWCRAGDDERLEALTLGAADEAATLTAA